MKKYFLLPIIICIFAMLTFLYWQFIYIPVQSEILNMQIETRKLQATEKKLRDFEARYGDLKDFAELIEVRLNEAQNYLPDKPLTEKFTAELYKVAEKNKIALTYLQVGDINFVEDNKNLRRQSIKIKLAGDYVSILNFLREILDGERFINIENILIENRRENFLDCDAEFYIYSRAENL